LFNHTVGDIDTKSAKSDVDLFFSPTIMKKIPKLKELLETSKENPSKCN